ncbi:alpha/beta hydrolase [Cellvibrio sp.]
MFIRKIFLLLVLGFVGFMSSSYANQLPPFGYPAYETVNIHANSNNKDYELYVQLPKPYNDTKSSYPLIIVNDTNFAFPVTNGAMALMGGAVVKEAIVVGISYSKGDDRAISRTRDYTPTFSPIDKNGNSSPARMASGHAKEYVDFIESQVIPLLQKRYRIDSSKRIFVGHSYGGLLGTYILFKKPHLFTDYIIGSPSLWYDNRIMFALEKEFFKTSSRLPANVAMFVGSLENDYYPMVTDLLAMEKQLRSRNYEGFKLRVEVLQDENHHSVFPSLLSRGLMATLPLKN